MINERPLILPPSAEWRIGLAVGGPERPGKKLIRAAREQPVNMRDIRLPVVLLHTGLRVGEACAMDRGDTEISKRKGLLMVRQGKGNKGPGTNTGIPGGANSGSKQCNSPLPT